jgi:PEP-CTERM motif-containing protein
MNGKTILKFAAVTAAVMCVASARVYAAATVALGADDSNFFATSTGVYLNDGSLVEMGQFSVNDATIAALASGNTLTPANYATLLSDFVPLSGSFSFGIGTGTSAAAGDKNSGAISATFSGSNAGFASGAIYLLVINSNTTGAATQVGVFKGDTTWTYPANMNTGGIQIDTDNALTAPLLGTFASVTGAGNGYNNTDGNGNATLGQLRLDAIVPEPSTYLLVGTGLLGLLGLRRRRS